MNADESQSLEIAPLSPDYVPSPEEPEQAPFSPKYAPEPVYQKYLAPSDNGILIEYQPLLVDASPIALLPGYIVDPDLKEDPEDDPEEDPADYPTNRRDKEGEEESSIDDVNDEDEEETSIEEDDDDEEEEHLPPADSSTVPIDDYIPSAGET
ncbi:hypothetical protein Tco_0916045 [Tanacetum coccineum]